MLAHSLSVIVVQAEGAKALMVVKKPDVAGEALDVIANTGRTSIQEIRRIVAVLRQEEDEAQFAGPVDHPDSGDAAAAGDRITLAMPEEVPVVPDSVGLTAFRVVQESVTNF